MSNDPDSTPGKSPLRLAGAVVFALAGIAFVAALALGLDFESEDTNEWYLFLGRFHPLIIHLPIGALVIAAFFEWGGWWAGWRHLRRAVPALLVITAVTSAAAVWAGCLLVAGEGRMSGAVENHFRTGVAFSVGCFLLVPFGVWVRQRDTLMLRGAFQSVLGVVLVLLVVASHYGGSLTHGPDYLVRYMPEGMKDRLAALPAPVAKFAGLAPAERPVSGAVPTLFEAVFEQPIREYCYSCHQPDRIRGGLVMLPLEDLMRGGDSGPSVVLGDLEASELLRRVTLPRDDEEFMPPTTRPALPDQDIENLRWWIASGLPGETPAPDVADAPPAVQEALEMAIAASELPAQEEVEPEAVIVFDPDLVEKINAQLSGRVSPISRDPEDGLLVSAAGIGESFTDSALEQLSPLAEFIAEADLSRTGVTDGGMAYVASWQNLRRLRLDHTGVGDAGVALLRPLTELESLNLFQTAITPNAVEDLLLLPGLSRLFAAGTALEEDAGALEALAALMPGIPSPLPEDAGEEDPAEEDDEAGYEGQGEEG